MRSRTKTVAVSAVAVALGCMATVPVSAATAMKPRTGDGPLQVASSVAQNRLEHTYTIAAIGPGIGIGILVGKTIEGAALSVSDPSASSPMTAAGTNYTKSQILVQAMGDKKIQLIK